MNKIIFVFIISHMLVVLNSMAQHISIKGVLTRTFYSFNSDRFNPVQSYNLGLISDLGINVKKDSSIQFFISGIYFKSKIVFTDTYSGPGGRGGYYYDHEIKSIEFNPQIGFRFRVNENISFQLFYYHLPHEVLTKNKVTEISTGNVVWDGNSHLIVADGLFDDGGYGLSILHRLPVEIGKNNLIIGLLTRVDNTNAHYEGNRSVNNYTTNDLTFRRASVGLVLGIGI